MSDYGVLRPSFALSFVFAIGLLTVLVLLAVLQYQWIGEVSEAERQRLQNNLSLAANRFAEEFNGEVARTQLSLVMGRPFSPYSLRDHFGDVYLQWMATAAYPQIVKSVHVVEILRNGTHSLLRFGPESKRMEPADWPDHLREVKRRLALDSASGFPGALLAEPPGTLFASSELPMAVMPIAVPGRPVALRLAPDIPVTAALPRAAGWAIIEFNLDCIVNEIFPNLVRRYFSAIGETEYRVAVTTGNNPRRIIYRSDSSLTLQDLTDADLSVDLFGFRPGRFVATDQKGFVMRADREVFTAAVSVPASHWQLFVEHRLGSVDAAVDRLRRRNLAVSFGILLVLLGSVVMIIVASERARMLAKLQMKFAAGVSHELRTPLAAIQTMAYNLTAGIVRERAEIEQYAGMMLDEARGLAGMVDQVLLFAETQSKGRKYEAGPLEVVEVLDRALAGLASQIRETRCGIATEIPDDIPVIRANETALTHCLRNLVANALKYGQSWSVTVVRIAAAHVPADREVRITVVDSGPGIDDDDLPHIFTAFYRGQSARPGSRGAGLGLYLVKRLIEAQGGRITVATKPGAGSAFTLHVPVFNGEPRNGPAAVSR